MSKATKSSTDGKNEKYDPHDQGTRETLESIIVAFVLAFLFRAFVAEAFVIPTGSMAPTLMGAHKDVECAMCGQQFQASASDEFVDGTAVRTGAEVVAATCPACRGFNELDLEGNANHATFNGDRILVSKFDYILSKPKRWDVIVFKNPLKPHQNYIKRLVGLPGDDLAIREGDVYVKRGEAEREIARKPPHKIRAMRQLVSDTSRQAHLLVESGKWPSLWQPWNPVDSPESEFQVKQNPEGWSANLDASDTQSWLRYYHRVPPMGWLKADELDPLRAPSEVKPTDAQLITDFVAYNTQLAVNALQPNPAARQNFGNHWVSDLITEYDLEVVSETGKLFVDLVEFGIHFRATFDVGEGTVALSTWKDGQPVELLPSELGDTQITSGLKGKGSYRIEFSNVDEQLVLWVNGTEVDFGIPVKFDTWKIRKNNFERRPYWTESDPLDAAPAGLGGQNLAVNVERCAVYRDIYYVAAPAMKVEFQDLGLSEIERLINPEGGLPSGISGYEAIQLFYRTPKLWKNSSLFTERGQLNFSLLEDQYFPMGDNSNRSSDARFWEVDITKPHNFVEKKFMLGKALIVFGPIRGMPLFPMHRTFHGWA